MSAAHTPGPWKDTGYGVRDSGGFICSMTWPCHYPGQDERYAQETAQREADARLIAAAPDLLDALHTMVGKAGKQNWNDQYPDELAQAFAAIAKATGASS